MFSPAIREAAYIARKPVNATAKMGKVSGAPQQMPHMTPMHFADGGDALQRGLAIANKPVHIGPIHSSVAGRTDHIPLDVPSGSYVIPADIVSGLGEGNTMAGYEKLNQRYAGMMVPGAYRKAQERVGQWGKQRKAGGVTDRGMREPVQIMAAGGEYVVPREAILHIGEGNLRKGHIHEDKFVRSERAKLIKTLRKLRGPAQS